jgi:hypothetical protein
VNGEQFALPRVLSGSQKHKAMRWNIQRMKKRKNRKHVLLAETQRRMLERIRSMVAMGAHPAVVEAQIETEIQKLRHYMSPFDVARTAWPDCIRVPMSDVPRAVFDECLRGFTPEDLRQGVFIRKRPDDPKPCFVMSWETSQRKKTGRGSAKPPNAPAESAPGADSAVHQR